MPQQFIILIFAAAALLVMVGVSFLSSQGSLNNIKSKPVGDGQHGTARWATPKEIGKTFHHVPFRPTEWRKGTNRPKVQGLVLGSLGKKGRITALVDSDDIHCLMIGAAGVGKTAFFLYPNLEYACACGMSFLALDTNGNAETMPGYQFLCCDLGGMVRADSRLFIDVSLTLDGNGGYKLFSDAYVFEGGNRAVIGDDTGLGMVLTTNADGTYVTNPDGTVTTSVPTHAVFEMQTDTYSTQMKGAAGMAVNGNDADGVYDSNDEPAVLDFVPETVWTLGNGTIESYREPVRRTDGCQ